MMGKIEALRELGRTHPEVQPRVDDRAEEIAHAGDSAVKNAINADQPVMEGSPDTTVAVIVPPEKPINAPETGRPELREASIPGVYLSN